MNWDRVIDRGARITLVVSALVLVFGFCWFIYEVYAAPSWLSISVLCGLVGILVYAFYGSWRK